MYETEIKFKTTERKTKLTDGKVCYQGQLVHNQVLNAADTRRYFAQHMGQHESQTNMYLDGLCEFMREYLSKGYRLDFGGFAAELHLRGGFPAANSPFDPVRNAISVELQAGSAVKKAVNELKPVNVTFDEACRIYSVYQISPFEAYDAIARDGERLINMVGTNVKMHEEAEDEGVWIENDAGVRLAQGVIQENTSCRVVFKLTESIAPGLHWIVACSRQLPDAPLVRTRRRLTVA